MTWSNPVVSIAESAAVALEIAQAILSTGIGGVSLLGAPILLYNNSEPTPVGTPGLVGATVSNSWFPGLTEAGAITQFNTTVGLPLGNQVQRVYYLDGMYPASVNVQPLAAIIAAGAKVQVCLRPLIAGLTNPGTAASEQANITATINMLQDAHVEFDIVLYTEANLSGSEFTSAAQYIDYIALYGPTVRAGGTGGPVKLVYNPASYDQATAVSYYPGDSLTDAVSIDYYGTDWKQGITLDAVAALADNHLPDPVPFGISEWNAVSAPGDTMSTPDWNSYTNYLINYMSTRLSSGMDNWDVIGYYGLNVKNSPLNQITSSTDFKVPQVQAVYNDLSNVAPVTPGLVVNGGITVSVPPINPTPGGGYAMASGISYDLTLNLVSNATGSTNPFVIVQFNWFNVDAPGAIPVAEKRWHLPIGENGSAGTITTGTGTQYGQYLQIKITNNDTIACTVTTQVNSTSRSAMRDDWYWDAIAGVNVPGFTESNVGGSFSNSLISVNGVSIGASSSKSYLMSLFSGQVFVSCSTGTDNPLQFLITPQPTSVMGGGAIYDETTTSDARVIFLPRAPCLLTIVNSGGSAVNAYAEVVCYD